MQLFSCYNYLCCRKRIQRSWINKNISWIDKQSIVQEKRKGQT